MYGNAKNSRRALCVGPTNSFLMCLLLVGLVANNVALASSPPKMSMRQLATTESTCDDENAACMEDTACTVCVASAASGQAACAPDDFDDDTATCSEAMDVLCCTLEDEDECVENSLLADFLGCIGEASGCDVDIGECLDSGASGSAHSSGATVFFSAAAASLLVAGFSVVV